MTENFVPLDSAMRGERYSEPQKTVSLIRSSDVEMRPVEWLWRFWLARGKFHVLAGPPGVAKTTIALSIAAVVSRGGKWPDNAGVAERGSVVIWSGEDDASDTLAPRLAAAGADRSRVYHVGPVKDGAASRPFDPGRDLDPLRVAIEAIGDVSLIIVDPVVSAVTGDSHKNTEVRRGLQPLCDLAAASGAALLGISHFSKGSAGRDPVDRVTGSLAFGAVARVVMVAAKASDSESGEGERRILARAKSNIGPDDGGIGYRVEQVTLIEQENLFATTISWGEPVTGTARELLAAAEATADEDGDDAGSALDGAESFLRVILADGRMASSDIKSEAGEAGVAWATVRRAADRMKVIKEKDGFNAGWFWRLPDAPKVLKNSEDAHHNSMSTFDKFEHLRTDERDDEVSI